MCFNPLHPELGPDLIFDQDEYLENEDLQYFKNNLSSLMKCNLTNNLCLLQIIEELILLYKHYQVCTFNHHLKKKSDSH